ncbi:serine hydrolase domain-containing protein [Egbenema bharatensis]|uniref:serine hydrolase domain-containing protein n=1 Tax=Egbenema bharatensis TaxID=3463334 RepID=UPI003A8B3A65
MLTAYEFLARSPKLLSENRCRAFQDGASHHPTASSHHTITSRLAAMKWMLAITTLLLTLSLSGCRSEESSQSLAEQTSRQQGAAVIGEILDTPTLFPPDIETSLQRRLAQEVVRGKTPGIAMYVATSDGIWMGAEGTANQETGTVIKPTDRFRIGRTTNLFVAVVYLQLVEEGILDLHTPIAEYLPPEISDRFPDSDTLQIRQLLNHTSGLADAYTNEFLNDVRAQPDRSWTTREILAYAYDLQPATVRGVFSYSSTNYLLLELILETVTQAPLAEVLQQRIQTPAGLTNTFLELREPIPGGFTQGYQDWNNNGTSENVTLPLINPGLGTGDRGLVSNATDLVKFVHALLYEDTLLYRSSLEELLSSTPRGAMEGSGLGITHLLTPWGEAWGQISSDLGFQSVVLYLPVHDLTMVLWVNEGDRQAVNLLEVAEDALRLILGEPKF